MAMMRPNGSLQDSPTLLREAEKDTINIAVASVEGGVEEVASALRYLPTTVALFPVFASFLFGSHSENWTDLMLLVLVGVYLHHCVTVPWEIYNVSRRRNRNVDESRMTEEQKSAQRLLRSAELQAFGGCILGPLLGGILLHFVRNTMARPANGLISNFNVMIFVLAAELRPLKVAYKYLTWRSSLLQEKVHGLPPGQTTAIMQRLENLEVQLKQVRDGASMSEQSAKNMLYGRKDAKSEVESIKVAIRRLERIDLNQQSQLEERFVLLDRKIEDLYRARRMDSQVLFPSPARHLANLMLLPLTISWRIVTSPFSIWHSVSSSK